MFICTMKFDRRKAAFWVIMTALVIIGVILLVGTKEQRSSAGARRTEIASQSAPTSVRSEKKRVAYLEQYGWNVDTPALSEQSVVIPREFNSVFRNYNELQKQQGFDLSEYCGMEVTQYVYRVLDSDSDIGENTVAVLYVFGGSVIGGDVHSTALDGRMVPIIN